MWSRSCLMLTGCAPTSKNRKRLFKIKRIREKAIIPKYKISDEYYRTILPFEPSEARGLVVNNLNTRYDINEFETGLMRIAQNRFEPINICFKKDRFKEETVSYG